MPDLLIENIARLVTPIDRGGPLTCQAMSALSETRDAAVYCRGGVIIAAGDRDEVMRVVDAATSGGTAMEPEVFDAGNRLAVPGYVDPHTHLVFSGDRAYEYEQRIRGAGYLEILAAGGGILNTVKRTRAASEQDLFLSARQRARLMAASGTTCVEVKSGYGLTIESEIKMLRVVKRLQQELPLSFVPTLLGAHAVPAEFAGNAEGFVEYVTSGMLPEVASARLAEFVDVFCETGVFSIDQTRRILQEARMLGFSLKIHADEIESTGGAELSASERAVSADHLLAISGQGISDMAAAGVVGVLLPTTAIFIGKRNLAPAREMIDRGVPVALATDCNPGTSPVTSMALAMSLACSCMRMTPAEALTAATINAAHAINRSAVAGSIEPGKCADIVVADAEDYREIPYFMGANLACAVFRHGSLIARDGRPIF